MEIGGKKGMMGERNGLVKNEERKNCEKIKMWKRW